MRFRAKLFDEDQENMHGMTAVDDGKDRQTGVVNTSYTHEEPRSRKVSISNDAVHADEERQRKISSGSYRKHNEPGSGYTHPDHALPHPNQLNLDHLKYAARTESSWWFLLCTKCRQKETGPGWEPSFWQSFCPYPFCPTYRHMARCFSLFLFMLMVWGVVYSIIGDDAAPGGQLFDIAVLVILAHFGGYIFRIFNIPGLVGMLMVGIIYQNIGMINIHGPYTHMSGILRKVALVIILTRAGLDLDPGAMRRLFATTLRLGLVPWAIEAGIVVVTSHYFLDLPWIWGLLTGGVVAAVSPAVVVPCLMRLRGKGYGVAKGIPTVVIAISGIDDAASVAAFGIVHSLMFSEHSLLYNIALGPLSVVGGVGFGILWGLLSKYVPEKGDPFVVPMRILMLMGGGLIAVFGSETISFDGAGPLGVVVAAFVSSWVWSKQGWNIEDNPVATAFEIFWMVFEPILFSLTGTQIRLNEIEPHLLYTGAGCLAFAAVVRLLVTVLVGIGASLNMKEKIFVALSCMTKASVQAALSSAALSTLVKLGHDQRPETDYAEIMLVLCVLSIAMTAPLGAILITILGPRMLTRTIPGPPSGWRHSARPSLRDITVIDEGNEADDIERRMSHSRPHQQSPRLSPPNVVITQQP